MTMSVTFVTIVTICEKCFADTFAIYLCIDASGKPPHDSVITLLVIFERLFEVWVFP